MKLYILNIAVVLISLTGYSQIIKPLETEWTVHYSERDNSYFKDVNNELDKFVGTWRYEDTATNTIFEITFTKELHHPSRKNGFVDQLSAQFKLTINGVEQYNTYLNACEDCFINTGFSTFTEGYDSNDNIILLPVNVNMYIANIAEPAIEDDVLSSDLKLVYQGNIIGGGEQLVWTNKVSYGKDYVTGEIVNNYQMPLEMVLIKQ